jgi:hypothetical protein
MTTVQCPGCKGRVEPKHTVKERGGVKLFAILPHNPLPDNKGNANPHSPCPAVGEIVHDYKPDPALIG